MEESGKVWILAPNFSYAPDGPIRLGAILSNPLDPESNIEKDVILMMEPEDVQTTSVANWKSVVEGNATRIDSGLFTEFLSFFRRDQSDASKFLSAKSTEYRAAKLETSNINPSSKYLTSCSKYLAAAMNTPAISRYLSVADKSYPVYLVTGVRIAHGASVDAKYDSQVSMSDISVVLGGAAAATISPATSASTSTSETAFASISTSERSSNVQFKAASSFVFAYRLSKLYWCRDSRKYRIRRDGECELLPFEFPGQDDDQIINIQGLDPRAGDLRAHQYGLKPGLTLSDDGIYTEEFMIRHSEDDESDESDRYQ